MSDLASTLLIRQSLNAAAARNLATATVTLPQNAARTPRWMKRLLPWVDVDGGVYRVNRRKVIVTPPGRVEVQSDGAKFRVDPPSLVRIPLFSEVDPATLSTLAAQFEAKKHPAGMVLVEEGATAKRLYVVAQGKLELSVVGPHGDKLRQDLLGEGGHFGESALVNAATQFPTLKTLTAATVLTLDKTAVDGLSRKDAAFRAALVQAQESRESAAKGANEYGEKFIDLSTMPGGRQSGEPRLPTTFVDYEEDPREYHLGTIQTVLQTHTRVTDLYSNRVDQLSEQVRLAVEAVNEWEEWEIINNAHFGLLREVAPAFRIPTRSGPPTPDDLDELLSLVWKKPAFFLAHPKAIAAFGRECTRRGVLAPTVQLFGSPFLTWRGVPLIPTDKLLINGHTHLASSLGSTSILLLRVGESDQGVVGLQKVGVEGEVEPGLSVRYMGTNEYSIASHVVTRYFSTAVLTEDAIARLDNVLVGRYHDYP